MVPICRNCNVRDGYLPSTSRPLLCKRCYSDDEVRARYARGVKRPCQHCGKRLACKPGRICTVCHRDRAIRARYVRPRPGRVPLPLDTPGRVPCPVCRERVAALPGASKQGLCGRCYEARPRRREAPCST